MKQYKFFEVIFSIAEMAEKAKSFQDKAKSEKVHKLIDEIQNKIEANNRLFEKYKYFKNINVEFRLIGYAYNTIKETISYLESTKGVLLFDDAVYWSEFGTLGKYFDKVKYILRKLYNLKGFVKRCIKE